MPKNNEPSLIGISYREDGNGAGAFFDHIRIQDITKHPTMIIATKNLSPINLINQILESKHVLNYGIEDNKRNYPPLVANAMDVGLIVIPGQSRGSIKLDSYPDRVTNDNEIIRQARLRGQPILALCGGSWILWQAYTKKQPDGSLLAGKTKEVKDHSYSRMIALTANRDAGYNKQIHRIKINEANQHSVLSGALYSVTNSTTKINPSVNSVHWLAVDEDTTPDNLMVTAHSIKDKKIAPKNRQAKQMVPEENVVESFETKYGVPHVGIQWHAEAYNENDEKEWLPEFHHNIIKHMAQAGDAYQAKQKMLAEFKMHATALKFSGLFKETKTNKIDQPNSTQAPRVTNK